MSFLNKNRDFFILFYMLVVLSGIFFNFFRMKVENPVRFFGDRLQYDPGKSFLGPLQSSTSPPQDLPDSNFSITTDARHILAKDGNKVQWTFALSKLRNEKKI